MPALQCGHFLLMKTDSPVTKVTSIRLACRVQMATFAPHKINPLKSHAERNLQHPASAK